VNGLQNLHQHTLIS